MDKTVETGKTNEGDAVQVWKEAQENSRKSAKMTQK